MSNPTPVILNLTVAETAMILAGRAARGSATPALAFLQFADDVTIEQRREVALIAARSALPYLVTVPSIGDRTPTLPTAAERREAVAEVAGEASA